MNAILNRINGAGYAFVEFALPMLVQSCVLILILLVADLLLRKKVRAVFRYWIWMLVLLKLILPTSLSSPFSLGSLVGDELASVEVAATVPQSKAEGLVKTPVNVSPVMAPVNNERVDLYTERIEPASAVMPETETKMAEPFDTPAIRPMLPTLPIPTIQPARLSWQAVVFLIWLAVVVVMGLLLLQRALFVRGLVMQAGQADGPIADTFESCRKLMTIGGKVGLKVSGSANSPAVCGLFRPVILVPQNLEQGLGTSQLQAVLLHELAHIRRGDLWVNLAQTLLQIFYVYNPLLWLANAIIRRIREQAVDETVIVAMGRKAQQYPQTLVHVAKMAFNRPAAGLRMIGVVESKSALAGRIRHILSRPIPKTAKLGVLSLLAIVITAAVLLPMAKAKNIAVLTVAKDGSAKYSSIQEAINAAAAGAVIHIGPGVYREHLKIDKPLTLEGAGWDKTTVMTRSAGAGVFEEAMRELSVRMMAAESDEQRKAIRNQFEAEFKENYGSPTLLVSDVKGVVVRGLKLTSPGRRLEGRSMSIPIVRFSNAAAELAESAVLGTPGDGIHVLDGSDVEIRDCLVAAVWSTGIAVGGAGAKISNCDIRNCHHRCVTIGRGGDSSVVRNCRISGSAWHGIRYDNCSPTIVGNLIFGNARSGIYASGKTSATVMQNLFYANEMVGISCWFQNQDTIEGNTFAGNKRSGLEILGASKPTVRKNIFFANPVGVSCGDISSDSPVARSDGVVTIRQNLFWKNENTTRNTSLKPETKNIIVDPLFVSADKKDFSLKAVSPARQSGIGASEPINFESPWPIQPEESAIIPEGQTRDSRKWKTGILSLPAGSRAAAEVDPSTIALLYHTDSKVRIQTVRTLAAAADPELIDDLIRAHSVENYTPVHNEYGRVLRSLTGDRDVRGKGAWKVWLARAAQTGSVKIDYLPIKPDSNNQDKIFSYVLKGPDSLGEMAAILTGESYDRNKCRDALLYMVFNDNLPEVRQFLSGDWLSRLFAHRNIDINHVGYVLNGLANPGPLRERINAQVRSCLDSDNPIVAANALNLIAGVEGYSTRFTVPGVEAKIEELLSSSEPEVAVQAQRAINRIRPSEKKPTLLEASKTVAVVKSDLQRIIDSARPESTIQIPKGIQTEPIVITKPLTLIGESRKDCVFEVTANRPAIFIDTKSKGKVTIEAVTIKWQLATSDRTEHPFAIAVKDTRAEVKNCRFRPLGDFKRCPVAINSIGFSELNIDTCRFEGFEYTVCFGQGTKGAIRNSLVMGSGHQGISLYSGATAEIVGNVVTGSKYHGVRSTGGTLNMTGNLVINNANRGVYLGNKSARGSITNNVIIGNGTGISGFAQSNVKIENNVIADSSYAGIGMRDSCSLSIRDNIFRGNGRGWIMFKERGRNSNAVYRNTFWRNKVDTENINKTADSIVADPAFADPDNGDFSLKPGPALEHKQGLKNPQVFESLWKRWKNRESENEPFTGAGASAGPLAVRFVGVRPDNGDDILDATGKKTGTAGLSVRGGSTWAADCFRRDFVFELPATEAPILFLNRRLVRPSRRNVELCSGQANPLYPERISGRTYVVLDTRIPRQYRRSYLGLINSRRDTRKVDVTLQYFRGPPAGTLFRFTGPFELGQTVSADNKPGYNLEITEGDGSGIYEGPGLMFRLTAPDRIASGTPILIYDNSGNRHLTWLNVFSTDSDGTSIEFRPMLSPVPLSGIKAIAAEEPRQYTVRNVLVDYPGRPARSHAQYLDTMAKRLGLAGLSPEQLSQYQFKNPQQAIEVIDIVRGDRHIRNAVQAIRYGKPRIEVSELDAQAQNKIRRAANQWAGWGYLSGYGIQLGLMGQWPEFFDMAIERLGGGYLSYQDYPGYERAMLNADYDIAHAVANHIRQLTPDQVRQLKELISRTADGVVLKSLFACLARTQSQAVIDASWELSRDDRPWIWWQAVQIWHRQTHTRSRSYDNLTDKIKLRLVLARGVPDDEQLRARAYSMLPAMFTPELARMASGIWSDVRLKLARGFDKKTATEVYIGFLRRMQTDMTTRRWAGNDIYKNRSKWMVAYLIRTLNVWYDVNIGNQGTDETADSRKTEPRTLTEFNQLISEALQWYDDNRDLKPAELVFSGRVVDTAGEGIADAILTLTKLENTVDENGNGRQQRAEVGTFRTDTEGTFGFVPPPSKNSCDLTVTAAGFIPRNLRGFRRLPDGRYRLNDGNIIEMQRPGRITGRIISEDGESLANAKLRLSSGNRYSRSLEERAGLQTDAQGRFVLDNVSSGYHVLSYHEPKNIRVGRNWRSQYGGICTAGVLHLDEGRSLENVLLDLTKSNCSLEVEVVDGQDNPVTTTTIWLQAKIPDGRNKFADIFTVYNTSERGVYRFKNLPPIEGYILVHSDEFQFSSKIDIKLIPQETVRCRIKYNDKVLR